jgi:hypothetical protein
MTHRESFIPSPKAIISGEAGPLPKRVKFAAQMVYFAPMMVIVNAINMHVNSPNPEKSFITTLMGVFFSTMFLVGILIIVIRKWRPASPLQIATFEDLLKQDASRRRTMAARIEAGMTFVKAEKEIDAIVQRQLKSDRNNAINRLRSSR